jgi:hypothetical protein
MRPLLFVLALPVAAMAGQNDLVVGQLQNEIQLADGAIFKQAKIVDCSIARGTAVVSDAHRIRTVPLQDLPAPLRERLVAEATRPAPRRSYRSDARPAPPPDKVIVTAAPTPSGIPATTVDDLVQRATATAPDELKFYLTKAYDRLASLTTKVHTAEQIPGWQKIRVSGDASFSQWDQFRRDYVWRTEKFEVAFDIVDGRALKLATVAFGGFSRAVE